MTISEQITELSDKWYRLISSDHHKDRDCHWYVETAYSYGNPPVYTAYINGYLFSDQGEERKSYGIAELDLLNMIKDAIKDRKEHADYILAQDNYDEFDVIEANRFYEIFPELK